jgi:hypothetical protein
MAAWQIQRVFPESAWRMSLRGKSGSVNSAFIGEICGLP